MIQNPHVKFFWISGTGDEALWSKSLYVFICVCICLSSIYIMVPCVIIHKPWNMEPNRCGPMLWDKISLPSFKLMQFFSGQQESKMVPFKEILEGDEFFSLTMYVITRICLLVNNQTLNCYHPCQCLDLGFTISRT